MNDLKNNLKKILEINNKTVEFSANDIDYRIFLSLEDALISNDVSLQDKIELVKIFLDIVVLVAKFEDNISLLPTTLQKLFKSKEKLKYISIGFETLESIKEYVIPTVYEDVVLKYLDFLDNYQNSEFITYAPTYINNFNDKLISYIKRVDVDGKKFEDSINKDILDNLKNKISTINKSIR